MAHLEFIQKDCEENARGVGRLSILSAHYLVGFAQFRRKGAVNRQTPCCCFAPFHTSS
jgi:hypothetical protein